jgi:S1-C subfamily serine protease
MGDSDQVEIGDHIFVIGAPYGATHSLSVGYISARRTADRIFEGLAALEVFQTDAAIYEGNSGGPIFNLNGEVIGIVSHVLTRAEGANGPGFAVTSNVARRLLLEQKRIWMGIEAWLVTGTLAEAFNVPQAAGMLVQSVADGSLGDRLGLREGTVSATLEENAMVIGGDIILEILGTQIRPDGSVIPEIQQILNGMRSGDSVTMKVLRRGRILELTTPISAE